MNRAVAADLQSAYLTRLPVRLAVLCGVAFVAAALYASTLNDFFLADDFDILLRANDESVGRWVLWPDPQRSIWFRPIPELLWRLDYVVGGNHPLVFRATNVLLHVSNAILVAWLAHVAYRSALTTTFAGLLFATFPRSAGAVSWLSGRFDLTAAFFVLLTVLIATHWRSGNGWKRAPMLALCCAAAIASKEVAYATPLILLALASRTLSHRSGMTHTLVPWQAPAVAAAIAVALLAQRAAAFGGLGGYGVHGNVAAGFLLRPLVLLPAFWPSTSLALPYAGVAWWLGVAAGVVLLGTVAPTWLAWVVIALLPSANLMDPTVPFFEFDRFFYLASAGWAIGLASLARVRMQRWPANVACVTALAILVATSGVCTRARNIAWATAGDLTRRVQGLLVAKATDVLPNAAIDCSALPDNVAGAYAYRNGCDSQVRLAMPGHRVRGIRFVPGVPPDPVSARRGEFDAEYRVSPDGRELSLARP